MSQTSSQPTIDMAAETITIRRTVDGKTPSADGSSEKKKKAAKKKAAKNDSGARMKADPYIWGIYILLVIVAIIELFSASTTEVSQTNVYAPLIRHGLFIALGLGIIFALQKIHYVYLSRFAMPFAVLSMALLFIANQWGANINGAQRAIMIGTITIQPAEIVKIAVIVVLAMILSRNQKPLGVSMKGIIESSIVVGLFAALTFRNGFTNMAIIMGVSVAMMCIGGIQWSKLFYVAVIYLAFGGLFYTIKSASDKANEFDRVEQEMVASDDNLRIDNTLVDRHETRENRIVSWWKGVHPGDKVTDENRQVRHSYMAQARGGLLGKGPGNSRESARLPLAYSDYIYSIIVEDTGLVGGVALLILYLLFVARAGVLAYRCKRAFPAFLIMGCAVLIAFQALVHMAIVTGACPVSGQPLPFISKGGTSVLVMSLAVGIMLSVSRYADLNANGSKPARISEDNIIPDDLNAANITTYNNIE